MKNGGVLVFLTELTNVFTGKVVEIPVTKVWADANNAEGIRPEQITLLLYADGVPVTEKTVSLTDEDVTVSEDGNSWQYVFRNLPGTRKGVDIVYTVREIDVPEGYTAAVTGDMKSGFTVTNTHGKINTTVQKIWIHNGNTEVPEELKVKLEGPDEFSEEFTLNEENSWTATAENLEPLDAEGNPAVYTWTEEEIPAGYILLDTRVNGNVTTLVNAFETATTVTVRKEWADGAEAHAEDSVKVVLYRNGTEEIGSYELNAANEWTATADNLPLILEGKAVSYSWAEVQVPGYRSSIRVTGNVTVITNTRIPSATGAFQAGKTWTDGSSGGATLVMTGQIRTEDGSLKTVYQESRTVSGNGLAGWDEVNLFTEEGEPIFYSLTEEGVSRDGTMGDYISTITGNEQDGFTVVNHAKPAPEKIETRVEVPVERVVERVVERTVEPEPKPETVTVSVQKVWDDDDNRYGRRPAQVLVNLSNGQEFELNAGNGWSASVSDLPAKDENGNEIDYFWTEQDVPGYELTETLFNGNSTVFVNRYRPEPQPETTSATAVKVWDDDNNAYGVRPANIRVTLSTGQTYTLNEANNWSVTVEGLPATDGNGNAIRYSWTESTEPGYTLTSVVTSGNTTVFTNRYRPADNPEEDVPKTSATVVKVWDDNDNEEGMRPSSLRVTLSNGQSFSLNEGNDWSVTVEDLPAEADGRPIIYTWTEQSVPGYTHTETVTTGTTTVMTNRYRPLVVPPAEPGRNGTPALIIEDYGTPLGAGVTINHVGDCYE